MRVLLDTNVIVDNLSLREPYAKDAKAIFHLIATNRITGYGNTSSITEIYYILRKTFNDIDSRSKVRTLITLFQTIEVTKADCLVALDSLVPDFEDALVEVCADKESLDFIVTRDDEFLKLPKAISPNEFLRSIVGFDY